MSKPKPLGEKFEIKLKMKSDWRIGAGAGRPGNIDSLVRRDADEMPFIPAKTLTGIWRDACETVAHGLDNSSKDGEWGQLLNYIFGDQIEPDGGNRNPTAPRPARISVRAARLPESLRKAIEAKPYLKDAVTFVKPGVSIHPRTGQTRTDFLRFEEMARVEAEMMATVELSLPVDLDDETRKAATALLVAGACFVERIGGKRRRGAGQCEMAIITDDKEPIEIDAWFDWIENHPDPALNLKEENRTDDQKFEKTASGDWVSLPLRITTKTPVIVPERTVGNLVKTLDYIPGTYLLPFITERLSGIDVRSAIAHGDLIVTNATPEVGGQQGRPTPLNLSSRKLDGGLSKGGGVINRFEDEEQDEVAQFKAQRGGYVGAIGDELPEYVKTKISVETHNVVDDNSQRPTSDVGGVFSYEAIDHGVIFRAELRLRKSLVEDLDAAGGVWRERLESESYRIGRSRKDDYGVVEIKKVTDFPTSDERRSEAEIPELLRVWLLSDLLLRDERLRPTGSHSRFTEELGAALGVKLALRGAEAQDGDGKTPRKMNFAARGRRIDSWNTNWAMPRPSLAGLAAGSCFVFEVKDDQCDADTFFTRLKQVEAGGLGERRAEGYGQICFNDPLLSKPLRGMKGIAKCPDKGSSEFKPISNDGNDRPDSYSYARLIETEGWRKEIRRRALKKASTEAGRKDVLGVNLVQGQSKPRMSQLGALRSILGQLREYQDVSNVSDWISHLKKSKNRADEWPKGSLELIEKLVADRDRVWELLKNDDLEWAEFTITQDGETALKNELWAEAVRVLVDACVRAQKRDLEELQKGATGSRG